MTLAIKERIRGRETCFGAGESFYLWEWKKVEAAQRKSFYRLFLTFFLNVSRCHYLSHSLLLLDCFSSLYAFCHSHSLSISFSLSLLSLSRSLIDLHFYSLPVWHSFSFPSLSNVLLYWLLSLLCLCNPIWLSVFPLHSLSSSLSLSLSLSPLSLSLSLFWSQTFNLSRSQSLSRLNIIWLAFNMCSFSSNWGQTKLSDEKVDML